MDFKKRFEGRTGHINKSGNIIDDQYQTTFYLDKPKQALNSEFGQDKRQLSQNDTLQQMIDNVQNPIAKHV